MITVARGKCHGHSGEVTFTRSLFAPLPPPPRLEFVNAIQTCSRDVYTALILVAPTAAAPVTPFIRLPFPADGGTAFPYNSALGTFTTPRTNVLAGTDQLRLSLRFKEAGDPIAPNSFGKVSTALRACMGEEPGRERGRENKWPGQGSMQEGGDAASGGMPAFPCAWCTTPR